MTQRFEAPGHRVLLYRGKGWVSALIRWQTRCPYTHAALLDPDGLVVEAREFVGVRETPYYRRPGEVVERFRVDGMTAAQWESAMGFARARIGNGYDYLGVARFVSRRYGNNPNRWFCSELVFAALKHAGVHLLSRIHPVEVSPALLARSPLLLRESVDGVSSSTGVPSVLPLPRSA